MDGETVEAHGADGPEQANTVLFLALYLILLAFFIMLNSSAEITEARARAVVGGVSLAPELPVAPAPDALALVADRLETELVTIFDGHVDPGEWRLQTGAGALSVRLPQRKAFGADSSVLRPTRTAMVQRLAEVFGDLQSAEGFDLVVRVESDGDEGLARRRAAALGRDLVRQGVASDRFSLQVVAGEGAGIEFLLQPAREE